MEEETDYESRYMFVKHPANKDYSEEELKKIRLCVTAADAFSDSVLGLLVENDTKEFEKTGNPVYAIRVFRSCHAAGVFPPMCVLDWLDNALNELAITHGKADIRALLGLKGKRGISNPLAVYEDEGKSKNYATYVHWLIRRFHGKITIDEAAYMVWARENDAQRTPPEHSWIAESYSKKWRKVLAEEPLPEFDSAWWQHFLSTFPAYSLPHGLKSVFEPIKRE